MPLTIRQIYYRMIGEWGYPKGKEFERALYNLLDDARRAREIRFEDIRDDGIVSGGGGGYSGPEDVIRRWQWAHEYYERDVQEGQPFEIQVWCEAAGMLPQLAKVTDPYSIPVYSAGGFNSITAVRQIVDSCAYTDRPTVLLHLGDCDPSGYSIYQAIVEDTAAFLTEEGRHTEVGSWYQPEFRYQRVALNLDQLEELDVEPDEVSLDPKDTRARTGGTS